MAEKRQFHRWLTTIWWIILLAGSMYLMLSTANSKAIVIADGSYEQGVPREGEETAEWEQSLALENTREGTGIFLIPVEKDAKAEDVVVENCYMDKALHIFIGGAGEEFYGECSVQGDVAVIESAGWEKQRRGVLLKFRMNAVYEYRTSMEGDMLRIEVCDPHELYRLLVVVDPAGQSAGGAGDALSGTEGKAEELALSVSRLLPGQLENENIRLYFTRTEDREVTVRERLAFVEEVRADLFLVVGAASEDAEQYGICGWYNESYFIPEFGNVELADIVTKSVTLSCGNRAVGLKSAGEDSILQDIRIPAAGVDLGNLNNKKERTLLARESYREKLAQGIAGAIGEVYTRYYE